jgi:hypothetical protein
MLHQRFGEEERAALRLRIFHREHKDKFMVQSSTQSAANSLPQAEGRELQSLKRADLTYQVVTVAAIVLLLASLWVF